MLENYFRGVLASFLGTGFITGYVFEWQIDMIKESILRFNETKIEHSQITYQEKEAQKRQLKQSLDSYIQGVKDLLAGEGRLVKG